MRIIILIYAKVQINGGIVFMNLKIFQNFFVNHHPKTVCHIGYNVGSPTLRGDTVGRA